jgi:NAD-dependent deacetylase sirtuin 3
LKFLFFIKKNADLKVEPFANIIQNTRNSVPRLLLNKESVGPFKLIKVSKGANGFNNPNCKDLQILGDLINCVDFFVEKLGWKDELDELVSRETKALVSAQIYLAKKTILNLQRC